MGTTADLIAQGTELYNKGDVEGFCALYADDVVLTTPDGRFEGRDAVLPYLQTLVRAFPDVRVTLGRRAEEGDVYLGEFTLEGTHTGPLPMPDGQELPPTQRAVRIAATEVAESTAGKIVKHDMVWDNMTFLVQLGLVPPP